MVTFLAACEAMGTRFEVMLLGEDETLLRSVSEEAFADVASLEAQWSVFRMDSEVSQLNRQAAHKPVQVSASLMALLQACQGFGSETDGAFDPTVGRLMERWGFRPPAKMGRSAGPSSRARARPGKRDLVLDAGRRTVRFLHPDVQLDFGAIGKGCAVDAMVEVCREAGVVAGLLHAGTSTVYALGAPPGKTAWDLGIPRPSTGQAGVRAAQLAGSDSDDMLAARVRLRDQALGISAIWGRTVACGGEQIGHVLDPSTGRPVAGRWLSACVASTGAAADAYATGLLAGGPEVQARLAERRPDVSTLLLLAEGAGNQGRLMLAGAPRFQTCLAPPFDV